MTLADQVTLARLGLMPVIVAAYLLLPPLWALWVVVPYVFVDPADALDDNDPDDDLVVNLDAVDVDEEM